MPSEDDKSTLKDQVRLEIMVELLNTEMSRVKETLNYISDTMMKISNQMSSITSHAEKIQNVENDIAELKGKIIHIEASKSTTLEKSELFGYAWKVIAALLGWGIAVWAILSK